MKRISRLGLAGMVLTSFALVGCGGGPRSNLQTRGPMGGGAQAKNWNTPNATGKNAAAGTAGAGAGGMMTTGTMNPGPSQTAWPGSNPNSPARTSGGNMIMPPPPGASNNPNTTSGSGFRTSGVAPGLPVGRTTAPAQGMPLPGQYVPDPLIPSDMPLQPTVGVNAPFNPAIPGTTITRDTVPPAPPIAPSFPSSGPALGGEPLPPLINPIAPPPAGQP